MLSDGQWDRISEHIIGDGRTRDNRMFGEAVLWVVRTGSPWRDLPDVFGSWNSMFRRFSRGSRKGGRWRIREATVRRFHYDSHDQLADPLRRLHGSLHLRMAPQGPRRPHALRIHLQNPDIRAASIHPEPDPPEAGTEQPGMRC